MLFGTKVNKLNWELGIVKAKVFGNQELGPTGREVEIQKWRTTRILIEANEQLELEGKPQYWQNKLRKRTLFGLK